MTKTKHLSHLVVISKYFKISCMEIASHSTQVKLEVTLAQLGRIMVRDLTIGILN